MAQREPLTEGIMHRGPSIERTIHRATAHRGNHSTEETRTVVLSLMPWAPLLPSVLCSTDASPHPSVLLGVFCTSEEAGMLSLLVG